MKLRRLKDISTLDFSTPSFNTSPSNPKLFNYELSNPGLFNLRLFNHELFNPRLLNPGLFNPKSVIEKSGVQYLEGNFQKTSLTIQSVIKTVCSGNFYPG